VWLVVVDGGRASDQILLLIVEVQVEVVLLHLARRLERGADARNRRLIVWLLRPLMPLPRGRE
jgi:hypothetical protein